MGIKTTLTAIQAEHTKKERKGKKKSPFEMSKSVGGGTDLPSSLFGHASVF